MVLSASAHALSAAPEAADSLLHKPDNCESQQLKGVSVAQTLPTSHASLRHAKAQGCL